MSVWVKILIGVALLVAPLALYAYDFITPGPMIQILGIQLSPLASLWTMIQGGAIPLVALIGLFVVWLELDELRIEKELKAEEEKEKKKGVKKKK